MNLQEILKEVDAVVNKVKTKTELTQEEAAFFGRLKGASEDVNGFFARMQKNAGIKRQ